MKTFGKKCLLLVATSVALLCSGIASAVSLNVSVLNIYQEGTGPVVVLGHSADARTGFNRLTANASFTARCNDSRILPSSGQNQQSDWALLGGVAVTVNVPETLPGRVTMSGFFELPRGTTVDCNYEWSASAMDFGINVGGQQVGGGETRQAGTQPFTMRVPSRGGGDWTTCIP